MFTAVVILFFALVVLVWSADKFVLGASSVARNFGISPMVVGLTIVAMGSSAPEMMVSIAASLKGGNNTAIGNAIGSNITNITLVLGITALFYPLAVSSNTLKKEIPLVLAVTALAYFMLYNLDFNATEGIVLFILFFVYIITLLLITIKKKKNNSEIDDPLLVAAEIEVPDAVNNKMSFLWLAVGLLLLPISAHYLVESATVIAKFFGLSDLVIGLTIIAIGTSLPELAASLMSIWKKEDDLALGNIIGSNIFNILAVLPFAGILAPGAIDANAATRDAPYMLAVTVLLLGLCFSRKAGCFRITRFKGAILLVAFIAYEVLLFSQLS